MLHELNQQRSVPAPRKFQTFEKVPPHEQGHSEEHIFTQNLI